VTAAGIFLPASARTQERGPLRFQHGVASGDPLTDRVILWTRVTPADTTAPTTVRWRVAADPAVSQVVRQGDVTTSAARDHTVKVDVAGLDPGRTYFYVFETGGERSPVGRTKTLPAGPVQRLRLATVSCANYPAGFFNVYRLIAQRSDLDAVVHLGDYIYEFANGEYGDGTPLNRLPRPLGESITLADYRQRYATYRTDPDLQEVHRQHPFIAVWDDHELANDAWSRGAQNHNPGEGEWSVRRAAAWKTYMEWMPVREQPGADIRLYRTFRFGSLVELVMLDTRALRDQQVPPDDLAGVASQSRHLLGAGQEAWLYETLNGSQRDGLRWRLLGQQTMFSRLVPPGRPVQSPDAWEGYQAERERVFGFLQRTRMSNLAILTGDFHSSWAFDVPRNPWTGYQAATGAGSLAVEFVTPAVSSPGLFTSEQVQRVVPAIRASVPCLKYLEGQQRGYVLIDVTPGSLRADWYHAETVSSRSTAERRAASLVCEAGSARLTPA
jgi:alkaline phosphatase D